MIFRTSSIEAAVFVSNVLEKVVESRLENHLTSNNLYERVQSAYRACHSIETALLHVHHDISVALDNNTFNNFFKNI
jgi:hypothetical protein